MISFRPPPMRAFMARCASGVLLSSFATGVGHPEQSLSDMGRADAVCAQYRRPAGVTFILQVCEYSIEPPEPNRSFNLFAKDCVRATLSDEPKPRRPEMPFISAGRSLSRGAEGLTGTTSCPNRSVPPGEPEGEGPSADACEEVRLLVSSKVIGAYLANVALVNVAGWQMPRVNQVAKPLGGVGIELVVVGYHRLISLS